MIVVDTSAILAVALEEAHAGACFSILSSGEDLLMSAGTLTELLIVAAGGSIREQVDELLDGVVLEFVDVTPETARRAADAYRRWGRGFHGARPNFGDCFAYALAKERDCPLLYVGEDFAQTDVKSALPLQQ